MQPQAVMSVGRHQPLAMGDGGEQGGPGTSMVLHKLWGLPRDALGLSWWSHLPAKTSTIHGTCRGELSSVFK